MRPLPIPAAWLAAFTLVSLPPVQADEAELRGRVVDATTGSGIPFATVTLDPDAAGPDITSPTDLFGFYLLDLVPAGGYTLSATAPGYLPFSEPRAYAADELASEDITLARSFAGTRIDLCIQVTDTRTDVPLEGVPVRVQRFATSTSATAIGTTTKTSNAKGEVELSGQPAGFYEFRFNAGDDGTPVAKYAVLTPPRTAELLLPHAVFAKLLPEDQSMTVAVMGPDPADPETVPAFIRDAVIELTAVHPDFTVPPGFDPMTDDLREVSTPLFPPLTGRTDKTGGFVFDKLGPYKWIVTVRKPGYVPAQSLVVPGTGGILPPTHTVSLDLVPGTGIAVEVVNPNYPEAFLVGLPVKIEGLEGSAKLGTLTRGISRMSAAGPTGGGSAAIDFPDLLPGRYRASVDAEILSPPTPSSESAVTSMAVRFQGEVQFTVAEGEATPVVLEVNPVPAKIRGRFFRADERAANEPGNVGDLPAPLDRWLGPAYQLSAQEGIEFTQSALGPYLSGGPEIVGVAADALGNFELTVLPGFWGVKIPPLDGYWGSHFRSVNRSTGETFDLGWPYAVDPAATGGIPAHPFGSLGIPISSGDDLEIDLFVRKQTYFLDGTVIADIGCPLLDLVIARTPTDTLTHPFPHFAKTGEVEFDKDMGLPGGLSTVPLRQGFSFGPGDAKSANINASFLIEAPPGIHKVTLINDHYALPAGVFEIVGLPDYGFVGSGDAGSGDGIIPMEDNWGQLALSQGTVDPFTSDYKGDHSLEIEFYEPDGMGGETILHTRTFPDFIGNDDFPGRLFEVGAGFEMYEGTWTIYIFYDTKWYSRTFTIPVGAGPSTELVRFNVLLEGGTPLDEPPTPDYDFTYRSINAADPSSTVPNIKLEFDPPSGSSAPFFISSGDDGETRDTTYNGGYLPLAVNTSGSPDAIGVAKWAPEDGSLSPFTSYDLKIDVPPAGKPMVTLTSRHKRGSIVSGVVNATVSTIDNTISKPFVGIDVVVCDRHGNRLTTLETGAGGVFATTAALPAAPVLFIRVDVPGYKPYFKRFTPNSGDGTGPDIDYDLSTPPINLEMLPQPELLDLDGLFDRAGPFVPGLRKEPGSPDDVDPSLLMTWETEARSAAKWDQVVANFDDANGNVSTLPSIKVLDPVTSFHIISRKYFEGARNTSSASNLTLPAAEVDGDPDPLYHHKLLKRLRELRSSDIKPGHLYIQGLLTAPPAITGTGDDELATSISTGTLALPDLPPGPLEAYIVAVTRRGACKVASYPGASLGSAELFKTLYGLQMPKWLTRIADLGATYGKAAGPSPPPTLGILPVPRLINYDPTLHYVGSITDNPDGTVKYDYTLGANINSGVKLPFSGLSDKSNSILAYMAEGGISANGQVNVVLNGSRSTGGSLVGAPEINVTGGAAVGANAAIGGPGFGGAQPSKYLPSFAKLLAGGSPSISGESAMELQTSTAIQVPYRAGDTLGALDRRITFTTSGVLEPGISFDLSSVYNLIPAPPPIGLFLSGLAANKILPNVEVGIKSATGSQLTRETTTRHRGEIPGVASSLSDPGGFAPIIHDLGEEMLPLPGPLVTQSRQSGRIYRGLAVSYHANSTFSVANLRGHFGTVGTPVTLPGSTRAHRLFFVEYDRFGRLPFITRIKGAVGGSLSADFNLYFIKYRRSLGSFSIDVDWSPNTDARFYLSPFQIEDTVITPATSSEVSWIGNSPQLVQDLLLRGSYDVAADGTGSGALTFLDVDPLTGDMALKFALRGSGTSFGTPMTVSTAAGIADSAIHRLPGGGWMAAWSEAEGGLAALAPATKVKASTSVDGITWSPPSTVASLSGTAFDLRLLPMPGDDLGLVWLENERGPAETILDLEAALWDATTGWGPHQILFDDADIRGWDAAGPGFAGSTDAQFIAYTDVGGCVAAGWTGSAATAPVSLVSLPGNATECAVTGGPDDTFTAVAELDGGGVALFRKAGAAPWTELPSPAVFDVRAVGSLDIATTTVVSTNRNVIALAAPGEENVIRTLWLDPAGAPASTAVNVTVDSRGRYDGVRLLPLAGAHAAEVFARFHQGDASEIRWFGISEAEGVPIVDRDVDTYDDLAELRIVDAAADDAIRLIDDIDGTGDFDGDGSLDGAEILAGTDPTDPLSFPGQKVELLLTDVLAAEMGANAGVLHIRRSGTISAPLTVSYTVGGTATPGSDYPALAGAVSFAANQSTAALTILPVPDSFVEGDESVTVTLDAGGSYTLGTFLGTVTIADLPLDGWRFEQFTPAEIADLGLSGDLADFEPDGFPTLLEYAFDEDPKSGLTGGRPVAGTVVNTATSERHLAISHIRRQDGGQVIYTYQFSADLDTWTDAGDDDVVTVSTVDNGDGTETVTVRDALPISDKPSRMIRVRITRVDG